jgi:FkbH-like protein
MKLVEALEILHRPGVEEASPLLVSLAAGFEPLHLRTFLAAELTIKLPRSRVDVGSGTFDDLPGNIDRATRSAADAIAVVIEWPDLDPRLGLRRLGGWRPPDIADILESAEGALERLELELGSASGAKPVACCPPTLPLPPLFSEHPDQSGPQELALRDAVASFVARLARYDRVAVCSLQRLDRSSPPATRRDVRAELTAGFPYSVAHASEVATLLANLIAGGTAKKGLITDLDDTLWAGIVGEVGAENVSWGLEAGSQRHGIYQQLLASLASAGVLIAVASRNDPALVAAALGREDLLIPADALYPVEAHWGSKSDSIERILEAWNVGPDSVVVVDDDPLELDEARDAFPGLVTVALPREDSLWPFLVRVRELFGKSTVTDEDRLRLQSIRSVGAYREDERRSALDLDDFLARTQGEVEFVSTGTVSERALELINKTNQFNLNGRRVGRARLERALGEGAARLITASYKDRYGPLGVVVAIVALPGPDGLMIDTWVMSCRAFARRLEFHCIGYLFDSFGVDELTVAYRETDRNEPVRQFLTSLVGELGDGAVRVTREEFQRRSPALVHRVCEVGR